MFEMVDASQIWGIFDKGKMKKIKAETEFKYACFDFQVFDCRRAVFKRKGNGMKYFFFQKDDKFCFPEVEYQRMLKVIDLFGFSKRNLVVHYPKGSAPLIIDIDEKYFFVLAPNVQGWQDE